MTDTSGSPEPPETTATSDTPHRLHRALATIDTWPVDAAAAAVLGAPGTLIASHGDVHVPFDLASLTKVITATAVLLAVEEGTLALDEAAGPPGATVAHLLAHASGIGPDGTRLAAPGTRRIYANAGFDQLADHLAARSGIPFERYVVDGVLAPLAMTSCTLHGSAAHGARASVTDLAALAGTWIAPGRLLAPQTIQQATRRAFGPLPGVLPGYGRHDDNAWGLGVELRATKSPHWTGRTNSATTYGHFGQSGTFLWVDPVAGLAAIVLSDRPFGDWARSAWPTLSEAIVGPTDRN